LVTGHTGFKGGWLCLMLAELGAEVYGFADGIPTDPSFFVHATVRDALAGDFRVDVRDQAGVLSAFGKVRPDTVMHLAAQPLVLQGVRDPVGTFSTNLMGTVHVLEASRLSPTVRSCVVVTTDKVYRTGPNATPHSEDDELGGDEPYGASKAGAEFIAASYVTLAKEDGPKIATARAGNVIGGGDWSPWRLLPDLLAVLDQSKEIVLRRPDAVRPWQHVLDPLTGYLLLVESLESDASSSLPRCWNFGPDPSDSRTVLDVVREVERASGVSLRVRVESADTAESQFLALSSVRAREVLGWSPQWDFKHSVAQTVNWHLAWRDGRDVGEIARALASQQMRGAIDV
jgi:CDP-glucose 4,6-dehydratase